MQPDLSKLLGFAETAVWLLRRLRDSEPTYLGATSEKKKFFLLKIQKSIKI